MARRDISTKQAGYIDADFLHPPTFPLQSDGGPYISATTICPPTRTCRKPDFWGVRFHETSVLPVIRQLDWSLAVWNSSDVKLICAYLLLKSAILLRAQTEPHHAIGFLSGADLVTQCCNSPVNNSLDYFTPCTAYILGIQAGFSQAQRTNPKPEISICIPMGTPDDQLVGAVIKYADSHPQYTE
jgi:hypothetical protein